MVSIVTCESVGGSLVKWLENASPEEKAELCKLLGMNIDLPEGNPGQYLSKTDDGKLVWRNVE